MNIFDTLETAVFDKLSGNLDGLSSRSVLTVLWLSGLMLDMSVWYCSRSSSLRNSCCWSSKDRSDSAKTLGLDLTCEWGIARTLTLKITLPVGQQNCF